MAHPSISRLASPVSTREDRLFTKEFGQRVVASGLRWFICYGVICLTYTRDKRRAGVEVAQCDSVDDAIAFLDVYDQRIARAELELNAAKRAISTETSSTDFPIQLTDSVGNTLSFLSEDAAAEWLLMDEPIQLIRNERDGRLQVPISR